MIKQNVFIINNDPLYEILDEIKENLSFKIVKFDSEGDFLNNSTLDKPSFLIITKTNQNLKSNKNIADKNLLNFKELPLSLNKVFDLINIQLIKLRFNQQSKINIKGYELNLNSKFFSKNTLVLKLTEKEIEIILYLIKKKEKHDVSDLQKNIWSYSLNIETHTVETHVYRLRKKIRDKFGDEKFILSDKNGYFID